MTRKSKMKKKRKTSNRTAHKVFAGLLLVVFLTGIGMLIAKCLAPAPQPPRGCCPGAVGCQPKK
jgi:hypothetical protein